MALKTRKFAAASAVAAAFSLLAAPVAAVDLPRPAAAKAYDGDALNAERDRRRRWNRGNDIDAGDVIAGVLILGAIAAISGAGKNRDRERYEERYPLPNEDAGYRTPAPYERSDSRGIDRAVDICVGEVERGSERVGSVDAATRAAEGWRVSGELESGAPYSCSIGNDGQIGEVFVGDPGQASASPEDGQWDDDGRYETARAPDFE